MTENLEKEKLQNTRQDRSTDLHVQTRSAELQGPNTIQHVIIIIIIMVMSSNPNKAKSIWWWLIPTPEKKGEKKKVCAGNAGEGREVGGVPGEK